MRRRVLLQLSKPTHLNTIPTTTNPPPLNSPQNLTRTRQIAIRNKYLRRIEKRPGQSRIPRSELIIQLHLSLDAP